VLYRLENPQEKHLEDLSPRTEDTCMTRKNLLISFIVVSISSLVSSVILGSYFIAFENFIK
jgi:hypothetical protein